MEAAASQPTPPASTSPLADVNTSLAALHHEQHQALVGMRSDLERRFELLVQGQQEDRERFRIWMDREVRTGVTPATSRGPPPGHDPEVFLDLFERAAEACGWPKEHWPVRLIPLLSGEAQAAAQQLQVQNLLVFDDLKRAILQRVGRSPEQHRQRFRSLVPLPATRVAGRSGPACWRCGDPDHFIDRCPMMDIGTMIRVPDVQQAAHDQAGRYQIPVSIKGGTYQALVDSGCNQTLIHQSLIQPEALDMSRMVRVRSVHGDVVNYPLMSAVIQFRGQKHRIEIAVNPHLRHPLILGTNWPAFSELIRGLCVDASCGSKAQDSEATVRLGETEPGPSRLVSGEPSVIERQILSEHDDFPLEQSQDESLKHAFEQV
ncbi:hypothetical protein PO909_033983 [Leuciscus waleckii]